MPTTISPRPLKPPYPYFGGKRSIAPLIWSRFGDVKNYVEPILGAGAVLLGRPRPFEGAELVNDLDCHVANFFRAVQVDPAEVVRWAIPRNEADIHAAHAWLNQRTSEHRERMLTEPDYFDARIAGRWAWGACQWIGRGWCAGRPYRQVPYLDRGEQGLLRAGADGGAEYVQALADRLRTVKVCCGDWSRVLTATPTTRHGLTAVFLDQPYSASAGRDPQLYSAESLTVADDVRAWCQAHGDDPLLRIALCGYEGEHDELEEAGWEVVAWKACGGFGNQAKGGPNRNAGRERVWFNQGCVRP